MSKTLDSSRSGDSAEENEPGACCESMLITTDAMEEFSHAMSSSLIIDETKKLSSTATINEIKGADETVTDVIASGSSEDNGTDMKKSESFSSETSKSKELSVYSDCEDETADADDYFCNDKWLNQKTHIFILSTAGKPIYSLHGNEDKLATTCGVIQALVSFVQSTHDTIKSIHANGVKFVFLVRNPMILVAVSRTITSVQQTQMHLT